MMEEKRDYISEGEASYRKWSDALMADPETRAVYEEEAAKKELWLQLVEARQATGLTQAELAARLGVSQAQVARIEKSGYDAYTLTTLRRYVQALGEEYSLIVQVRHTPPPKRARASRATAAR
ncbi:MAG: helix-turn-helix domain-containing protein [Thermomicrobiales bacterium]